MSSSRPPNPEEPSSHPATAAAVAGAGPYLALDQIGYESADLERIRDAIHAPEGLVLVVGPARSGRSTVLHAMQAEIRAARTGAEAMLIEGIATAGVAQLAIRGAQAGHRVLSSMALGRACSALAELRRLGVTTGQIVDALSLVIGHRLIGRLCPHCCLPDEGEPIRRALAGALNTWLAGYPVQARRAPPAGCAHCGPTGCQGRALAYELIDLDLRTRALIASGADPFELEAALLADGRSIWDRGLKRVADGVISLDALRAAVRQPR